VPGCGGVLGVTRPAVAQQRGVTGPIAERPLGRHSNRGARALRPVGVVGLAMSSDPAIAAVVHVVADACSMMGDGRDRVESRSERPMPAGGNVKRRALTPAGERPRGAVPSANRSR
jgi:hypothetical protein